MKLKIELPLLKFAAMEDVGVLKFLYIKLLAPIFYFEKCKKILFRV